jgi:hypothetical protein
VNPLGVGVNVLSPTVALTSANNIVINHTVGVSVASGAQVMTVFDDVWGNDDNFRGIGGSGLGSIQQDPQLVDVARRNYHLLLASPCIDAGWDQLAPPVDYEGDSRVRRADIGADEFTGTGTGSLIFDKLLFLPFVVKNYER